MRFGPELDYALGGRLEGDISLIPPPCAAIIRALLLNRAPARLSLDSILYESGGDRHALKIHTTSIDDINGCLDAYTQNGFSEEKDLSRAVSGKTARIHLLRSGSNACVALVQTTNTRSFRMRAYKIIAFLPRLFPEIFREKELSETETTMLSAAFNGDLDGVEEILEKLYKDADLDRERNRQALRELVTYRLHADLRRARDSVSNAEHSAEHHLRNYMEQSNLALENRILIEGLEKRILSKADDADSILDFLKTVKTAAISVDGNILNIDVTGPLTNFDPDAYRVLRDKPYAHIQEHIKGDREDALLFFDALFLEESIKINMGARYSIEPQYGVRGRTRSMPQTAIPNPHIQYHSCLGQYRGDMQSALAKADFIGVINLCIASGLSLNIPESPTCGRFISDVTKGSQKAVLLPDGESVTYKQAVAWLKQQKGITEEDEPDGETNQTNA